jgi:hypothetical protein
MKPSQTVYTCSRRKHNGLAQADFFNGDLNAITFPRCSGAIHLVAFFLKPLGM